MSFKAMNWCWTTPLKGSEKLVLAFLCDRANHDTEECYYGFGTIGKNTGLGRRFVAKIISQLLKEKFIEKVGKVGQANKYRITFLQQDCGPETSTNDEGVPVNPGLTVPTPEPDEMLLNEEGMPVNEKGFPVGSMY